MSRPPGIYCSGAIAAAGVLGGVTLERRFEMSINSCRNGCIWPRSRSSSLCSWGVNAATKLVGGASDAGPGLGAAARASTCLCSDRFAARNSLRARWPEARENATEMIAANKRQVITIFMGEAGSRLILNSFDHGMAVGAEDHLPAGPCLTEFDAFARTHGAVVPNLFRNNPAVVVFRRLLFE